MTLDFSTYKNLIFIGDIHHKLNDVVKQMSNYSDTLFISTGDCNIGVKSFETDTDMFENIEYILASRNNILCIIRGNHDNPKYFQNISKRILQCIHS